MTTPNPESATAPTTESELLDALRAYFRNMPADERRGSYDLHGLLTRLEGTQTAPSAAPTAWRTRSSSPSRRRSSASCAPPPSSTPRWASRSARSAAGARAARRSSTSPHAGGVLCPACDHEHVAELRALNAPRRNPTARELRAMLYEVGNQDAPLSDEVMASLQAKVPA